MRRALISLLIILFFLSLACTSVKVDVKYAEGSTNAFDQPKPPVDPNQLPKRDPKTIGDQPCPAVGVIQKVKAITQETEAWCWAASALTIMEAHDTTTHQCNIVNTVYEDELTTNCCGNGGAFPAECWRNGWPGEAFNNYGFNWEWVEGPLRESDLAGQLCLNGPFIFVLLFEGGGGHTFVVKDWEFLKEGATGAGKLFLWVYDHYGVADGPNNLSPTDFQLWSYDAFVDGLWNGGRFRHALDYVQISPFE